MKKIPVVNPVLDGNERKYVLDCLKTNWLAHGPYVRKFEQAFAKYCGVRYAISCKSGTQALVLALRALGVGPGNEVIVPTLTYVTTAFAVSHVGARPVFVDSEPRTGNWNVQKVHDNITMMTKAIIPVHLYGHPADMESAPADIAMLEDAAEAHGARYYGKTVGSIGDMGAFSFFANKIITTGEGGMVTTSNKELADKARLLMNVGQDPNRRYWHTEIGYNGRLTNLQAAIGLAQLENLAEVLAQREKIEKTYRAYLENRRGIILMKTKPGVWPVCWMFSVVLGDGISRGRVMQELALDGIETRPFFYPVHTMPPYATGQKLPVAERLSGQGILLPTWIGLKERDIERISLSLVKAVEGI